MRRLFSVSMLVFVLLAFSVSAVAQDGVRAIPSNDNFANAKPLKFAKPVTITGIESASWEAGEEIPSCDSGDSHSVWFVVDIPASGQIDIYTYGTQVSVMGSYQPYVDQRVTLTVFDDFATIGVFEEYACQARGGDVYSPTQLVGVGIFNPGEIYIRASLDSADEILAPSQVRIQVQLYATELLSNIAFYDGLNDWTLVNGSNDGAVNGEAGINDGLPAFKFTGNAGQNAVLKQTARTDGLHFGTAATLDATAIYAHDIPAFEFVMKIKVTYRNGTTQKFTYRETRTFANLDPDLGYIAWYPLTSSKVAKVQVKIPFSETAGTLVISYVNVGINGIAPVRESF